MVLQSLDIVARSLAVKRIAVESPVYAYAKLLFESFDYAALEAHRARRGVHVSNAAAAFIGASHLHGFRITYEYLSEEEMRRALTILGAALRGSRSP